MVRFESPFVEICTSKLLFHSTQENAFFVMAMSQRPSKDTGTSISPATLNKAQHSFFSPDIQRTFLS